MDDIQSFYRERALIEKEYASKLLALSSKYFDKKAKLSTNLSVGDNPQVTPGSLENASLVTWTEILTETEQIGKEKQRLANEFTIQIADQVHGLEIRFEEVRKRYVSCHEKVVEERDEIYNEHKKAKTNYDATCQKMEDQRLKASKSYDRSKDKATKKMDEKEHDMNNAKNYYLVKINVANRIKDKYYREDVPEILDGLQDVNQARVSLLNSYWKLSVRLEKACSERCIANLDKMSAVVEQNLPVLDSAMFVKHNIKQWSEPQDFYYQPSPIWHDDEKMVTKDDQELRYLRKRLADASTKLSNETRNVESKLETYKQLVEAKKGLSTMTTTNLTQLLNKHLTALQAVTSADTMRLIQSVEVETIEFATNDKDLLSIPVEQTVVKRGLFGRKKVTTNNNVSVAPTVSASDQAQLTRRLSRISTTSTAASDKSGAGSGSVAGSSKGHTSFMGLLRRGTKKASSKDINTTTATTTNANEDMSTSTITTSSVGAAASRSTGSLGNDQYATALYGYQASGDDEISIVEGERLLVIDEDDGSGWVNVRSGSDEGLVPASYIQVLPRGIGVMQSNSTSTDSLNSGGLNNNAKKRGPAVAPKRGGKKVSYMIALYDYDAAAPDELTIRAGDKILVVGEDNGDGWTQGELNAMSGSFPTAYAKIA